MKNQRLIQAIGDAAIPLMGYFWWNWSLYFIALFFMLDVVFQTMVEYLKMKKSKGDVSKTNALQWLFLTLALFAVLHLLVLMQNESIQFIMEIWNFLKYADLGGIPQGLILFPLLAIVNYQRYKMEFLQPKLYESIHAQDIFLNYRIKLMYLLSFFCLLTGAAFFIPLPDAVILFIGVGVPLIFALLKNQLLSK